MKNFKGLKALSREELKTISGGSVTEGCLEYGRQCFSGENADVCCSGLWCTSLDPGWVIDGVPFGFCWDPTPS